MSEKISAEEFLQLRRPTIDLEVLPGRILTFILKPVSKATLIQFTIKTPSVYSDIVASRATEGGTNLTELQAELEAEKQAQLDPSAAMDKAFARSAEYVDYVCQICVAGTASPQLSVRPEVGKLSPLDLDQDVNIKDPMESRPNLTKLLEKIMEVSGYGSHFRLLSPSTDSTEPTTDSRADSEEGLPTPIEGLSSEPGRTSPEVSHRPLDSSELGLGTV